MQALRHIVCGTDFSRCAEQAFAQALALALSASAHVTLVHVCELGIDDLDEQRLEQCADALAALVMSERRRRAVVVTGVLRSGKPSRKLDNVAADIGASLIVVGRHGLGQCAELGSVSAELILCANRPVLTVPFDTDRLAVEAPHSTHSPRKI